LNNVDPKIKLKINRTKFWIRHSQLPRMPCRCRTEGRCSYTCSSQTSQSSQTSVGDGNTSEVRAGWQNLASLRACNILCKRH